ncbi:MAG TPA: hypothetical protein VN493_18440 [Thermoanaerobaculia bacterium]|nr:hypothetical protein [Thermoanaerobaculia bacterium]
MMIRRSSLPYSVFFLALVLAAGSAMAVPPNPNHNFCWNKCTPGVSCTTSCEGILGPTTCGAHNGAPANDLDSDGVANASDNCACVSNSNQANCDGDAFGDVCDSRNELWVFVTDLGACEWDSHVDWTEFDIDLYGTRRYQNLCTNSFCYDRYKITSGSCSYNLGCGSSAGDCCDCLFGNACYPSITCGSPACPF